MIRNIILILALLWRSQPTYSETLELNEKERNNGQNLVKEVESVVENLTKMIPNVGKNHTEGANPGENRTKGDLVINIKHPDILRQLTPEQVEAGRTIPLTPPLGTSTFHLSRLARVEIQVAEKLEDLAKSLQKVSQVLKRYSSSWTELSRADVGASGWVEHPLHAYALTKHVSLGWPDVEDVLSQLKNKTADVDSLLSRRNTSGIPNHEDLTFVAGGLARLHDFYSFNITAFADAQLSSYISSQPIPAKITPTTHDLYRIGKEAVRVNIWNSGVDFLRAALERYNTSMSHYESCSSLSSTCQTFDSQEHPFDNESEMKNLPEVFKKTAKMHDQVLDRKGSRTRHHSTHRKPLDKGLARKKKFHKKEEVIIDKAGTLSEGQAQYHRLCRGEDLKPNNASRILYCRYIRNESPIYLIGPLKMEVHSISPYVVTIQGVMTSSEVDDIQQVAASLLEKSTTFRHNGGNEVSYQRTSSTAWLWEHNHRHIPILTKRIEHLTGLNAQEHVAAETYQVVNYGVGGHYTVHHDAIGTTASYNRIATFLIYLTDVPQGGSTVFPWLGFGVQPTKGMALLWYNLNKSGVKDTRLDHAACPVLFGDKWIINKWLSYGGQMTRVPCDVANPEAFIQQPLS